MICFHHNDLDGRMSAAIVRMRYPVCRMYEINYGDEFPWNTIRAGESIYMVDFCLEPFKDMLKLDDEQDLTWIDHHKTAINSWWIDSDRPNIKGIRVNGTAACILTWQYLYPDEPLPESVEFAGRYDVWDHDNPNVLNFNYGMMIKDTDPKNQEMWKHLFSDANTGFIIEHGYLIKKYIDLTNKDLCKDQAFETKFIDYRAEKYKCLAVNRLFVSSYFFQSVKNLSDYDILIMFGWMNGKWRVSLRANHDNMDVARIAKMWSGGGHVGAAGFECDVLPFELR